MDFRIGTWNCFGMGQGMDAITANRAPAAPRFFDADVIAECASFDVICIQELLSRDAQQFFDRLGQNGLASTFRDDNRPHFRSATVRGTGLGIGSQQPLVNTQIKPFAPPRVGWDRLARKGTLYGQIVLDGVGPVDLLTAHLQAGYDPGAIAVRATQLVELRAVITSVGARERPFLVCGDFNIDGLADARQGLEYRRLAAALEGFEDLGAKDDLVTFDPHPDFNHLAHAFEPEGHRQRIDYIFYRAPEAGARGLECRAFARFFDNPLWRTPGHLEGHRAYASDHFGVTARFRF